METVQERFWLSMEKVAGVPKCGVYALYFEGTNYVYVGSSNNLKGRIDKHRNG